MRALEAQVAELQRLYLTLFTAMAEVEVEADTEAQEVVVEQAAA